MFSNNEDKKLDWMYKGPTALIDRESYLLGRSVDKTLEELNKEEATKTVDKLIAPPKNHVEHECIPPSIRDYNKIVKSEQVDLQAKLQEDPLVLIKRQEEESRRQFLQNPVQLKKLQEAMETQLKKRSHHGKTDKKLKKKLKKLSKQLGLKDGHKKLKLSSDTLEDEAILDTILMHKFNSLKNELSEDDLKNILLGCYSESDDSDEEKHKDRSRKSKSKSDSNSKDRQNVRKDSSSRKYKSNTLYSCHSESDDSDEEKHKDRSKKSKSTSDSNSKDRQNVRKDSSSRKYKSNTLYSCHSESDDSDEEKHKDRSKKSKSTSDSNSKDRQNVRKDSSSRKYKSNTLYSCHSESDDSDEEKHKDRSKKSKSTSDSNSKDRQNVRKDSSSRKYKSNTLYSCHSESDDSDEEKHKDRSKKSKSTSDSNSKDRQNVRKDSSSRKYKSGTPEQPQSTKKVTNFKERDRFISNKWKENDKKRLTEEEKEALRKSMMERAVARNIESARNFKRFKDEYNKPEIVEEHDKNFIRKELLKSANSSSVADRIKANVNNIQRSKFSMESNFLK